MRSGPTVTEVTPVLATGVGARRGFTWVLRAASFLLDSSGSGLLTAGIVVSRAADASAIAGLLSGASRPAYGQLRVLGEDLTTAHGRQAARGRVGVARRRMSLPPGRVEYDEFTLFQHVDPTASVGVPTFVLETGRLFLHLFDIMRILLG